jgi:hypothetical protein
MDAVCDETLGVLDCIGKGVRRCSGQTASPLPCGPGLVRENELGHTWLTEPKRRYIAGREYRNKSAARTCTCNGFVKVLDAYCLRPVCPGGTAQHQLS